MHPLTQPAPPRNEDVVCVVHECGHTGPLDWLLAYQGGFSTLGTEDMANEKRSQGYNSSVVVWRNHSAHCEGGKHTCCPHALFQLFMSLSPAVVLKHVHRLDHWLEVVSQHRFAEDVDVLQRCYPGKIVEYAEKCAGRSVVPPDAAVIVFPLSPKPHEVAAASDAMAEVIRSLWKPPAAAVTVEMASADTE